MSSAHECPLAITLAFLNSPLDVPDSACIREMPAPAFLTPGNLTVNLIPFEEQLFDLTVTGLVPDGWDSAGFGQYTAPGLGDTALVQQARASNPGLTVESMATGIQDFFDIPAWDLSIYVGSRT